MQQFKENDPDAQEAWEGGTRVIRLRGGERTEIFHHEYWLDVRMAKDGRLVIQLTGHTIDLSVSPGTVPNRSQKSDNWPVGPFHRFILPHVVLLWIDQFFGQVAEQQLVSMPQTG